MFIKEFDKVLLKGGETAYIVEILEQGEMYIGDIDKKDGETDTDFIKQEQIEKVLR